SLTSLSCSSVTAVFLRSTVTTGFLGRSAPMSYFPPSCWIVSMAASAPLLRLQPAAVTPTRADISTTHTLLMTITSTGTCYLFVEYTALSPKQQQTGGVDRPKAKSTPAIA